MGDWGFDDFKRYLKFQLGQRTELEAAGDDAENLYGIWVNLGYRELTTATKILGQEYRFSFPQILTNTTKTTSDGINYVDVPTGAVYIEDVYDETNNVWLDPISHHKFVQYTDRANTGAESNPTEWVRRGSYVYLHPTPDTDDETLRIYYKPLVANLEGTGATAIGAEWDEIVLQMALLKALRWTKEYDALETEAKTLGQLLDQQMDMYKKEELGRKRIAHAGATALGRGAGYKK